MTSNAKSVRDRTPKCSIVLSNVLAVVFRPTSTAVKPCEHILAGENEENNHSKPAHQLSGLELFDQFKEANRSTMLTRLTESFDEIRLKGWVFPFTLLIKGPHEDIEVIKEAWRRHFLRSPDNFIIKDIGAVSSIGMEVIQQAPFLPLTKSLVETIAALNSSQMVATQESIAEYLAKTYQYVHVPKLNVIHDCLGILIKERKIYHTGNGYFVSSHSPFDKPADAPKENGDTHAAKESRCVACEVISKGKSKGDKAKKKSKGKEKESAKNKENGKAKHSVKETENAETQTPVNHEELKRTGEGKEVKPVTPQVPEELSQAANETASEASSEGTTKKDKKRKKSVLDQISCFIKGKTLSVAEVAEEPETTQEQTVAAPSPPPQPTDTKRPAPLAVQEDTSVSRPRSAGSIRQQFKNKRALSAPPDNPSLRSAIASKENEETIKREVVKTVQKPRELIRSKSFVAAEKRPAPVQRSNSFTAPSTRVARQISTENPPVTWDRRQRMNYGDIIRNAPGRRTIHVSGPTACNIGIVRPMDTAQVRPLSRSNSMKKETPRKKGPGSLSPPSTPRMSMNPSGTPRLRENSNRPEVVRSKSFTEPGVVRLPQRQYSFRPTMLPHYESPLQQLLARQTPGYTAPPTTALRVTIPPKGRHYAPMKHSPASSKRTPPNSPGRKHPKQPVGSPHNTTPSSKERPSIRNDCTSPICYDTNVIDDRMTKCMCNGVGVSAVEGTAKFSPGTHPKYNYQQNHAPFSDGASSEHIYIEEMTSTSASEVTLNKDIDRYGDSRIDNEDKPMGLYKKFTEESVNDSLTFIGII